MLRRLGVAASRNSSYFNKHNRDYFSNIRNFYNVKFCNIVTRYKLFILIFINFYDYIVVQNYIYNLKYIEISQILKNFKKTIIQNSTTYINNKIPNSL